MPGPVRRAFTIGRNQHTTATLLPNGKVLMAGAGPGLLGRQWQNQFLRC